MNTNYKIPFRARLMALTLWVAALLFTPPGIAEDDEPSDYLLRPSAFTAAQSVTVHCHVNCSFVDPDSGHVLQGVRRTADDFAGEEVSQDRMYFDLLDVQTGHTVGNGILDNADGTINLEYGGKSRLYNFEKMY